MSTPLTKLAIFATLGLGAVAVAASVGGMEPNPKRRAGQKFGPLTLKESRGETESGEARWLVSCEKCGEAVLAHRACGACGHYKGRKVKAVKTAAS